MFCAAVIFHTLFMVSDQPYKSQQEDEVHSGNGYTIPLLTVMCLFGSCNYRQRNYCIWQRNCPIFVIFAIPTDCASIAWKLAFLKHTNHKGLLLRKVSSSRQQNQQ